jgi:CHAD domain-containing protein
MDRYRELERKFDADPGAPLPNLAGAGGTVGKAVESQLDATYFDTADARLAPEDEATWREVEVELLGGDRSFFDAVSSRLRAAGLTRSKSSSKLARVLGDRGSPARAAEVDANLGARRATAGAVMVAYLQAHLDQLVRADRGARSDDPHAVHAMRVATRRLRSTLATYRPLIDRQRTEPLRGELKWLGQVLGGSRDAEVLHRRMRALIAAQPSESDLDQVADRIDQELDERHQVAVAKLRAALDGARYFRLLDALDDLVAHPQLTALASKRARKQVPALVGQVARRVDRAAQAVSDDGTGQTRNAGLHEVRKCAKRARYAAESAVPVAGQDATRLAERMESLQEVLGEHQDSVAAQALLLKLMMASDQSGDYELAFGRLYAEESGRAHDARRAYKAALRRASAAKARRWTR